VIRKEPIAAPAKQGRKPKRKAKAKARKRAAPRPAAQVAPAPAAEKKRDRTGETVLDVGRVIQAMRAMAGIKTAAAQALKVSRTTLYAFLAEHPEIGEELDEIQEELLDVAESQVVKAINAGDRQTVRWYLELKGRGRGYVRRFEATGKDGGPIETRQKPDLSKLTDDEIDILLAAAERREQTAPTSE
jgi:ribosome-binding protein aMBF1 (putative translation factor)